MNYAKQGIPIYYIDPKPNSIGWLQNINVIPQKAGDDVPELIEQLLKQKE